MRMRGGGDKYKIKTEIHEIGFEKRIENGTGN